MNIKASIKNKLDSKTDCMLCGQPLVYATEPGSYSCAFCGKQMGTYIYCPRGHYICDSCHSKESLEVFFQVLGTINSNNPFEILELAMADPVIPLHGPEHHILVPLVIITALRNAGYSIKQDAFERALERSKNITGGYCAYYGVCGAAAGVGIAISVVTDATPLTGQERCLSMEATAHTLERMLNNQPRCCKRESRIAIAAAVDFLQTKLAMTLPKSKTVKCKHSQRNKECAHEKCSYYDQTAIVK